jgi:hypothetical protein
MVSFSKIKKGFNKGWSLFKAMANISTRDTIIKKGGNAYLDEMGQDVEIPVPKNVENIKVSSDITTEELGMFVSQSLQNVQRAPLTEPPDVVLRREKALPKVTNPRDDLDEPRELAYYPAGRNPYGGGQGSKPNIEAIRQWVSNTKVATSSNFILSEEFGEEAGFIYGKSGKELEDEIDKIAYKVARKIWYVGRKPMSMSDVEWQEETKNMRPQEGSFSENENWGGNFPYGETYKYVSGSFS